MAKQIDLDKIYMRQAYAAAELSHATRKKVGAMLVIKDEGRFEGVNGTPAGFDNNPEEPDGNGGLKTKAICLHAEANAIMKVACSHASTIGGTMYCTLTPCLECAKLIKQARIARVVYSEQYPYAGHAGSERPLGLKFLEEAGIPVEQLDMSYLDSQYTTSGTPHDRELEGQNEDYTFNATEDMHNGYSYD